MNDSRKIHLKKWKYFECSKGSIFWLNVNSNISLLSHNNNNYLSVCKHYYYYFGSHVYYNIISCPSLICALVNTVWIHTNSFNISAMMKWGTLLLYNNGICCRLKWRIVEFPFLKRNLPRFSVTIAKQFRLLNHSMWMNKYLCIFRVFVYFWAVFFFS